MGMGKVVEELVDLGGSASKVLKGVDEGENVIKAAAEGSKVVEGVADASKAAEGAADAAKAVTDGASTADKVLHAVDKAGDIAGRTLDFTGKHIKGIGAATALGTVAYATSSPEAARNVGAVASNTVGGIVNGVFNGSSADQAAMMDPSGATPASQTQQTGGGIIGTAKQLWNSFTTSMGGDASKLIVPALAIGAGALLLGSNGKSNTLGSLAKTAAIAVGGIAAITIAKDTGVLDQIGNALTGGQAQQTQQASAQQAQPTTDVPVTTASQPQADAASQPAPDGGPAGDTARPLADYDGPDDADLDNSLEAVPA